MATKKQETHANTFKGQDAAHAPHYSGLQSRIAPYGEYRKDFRNRSTGIIPIGVLSGRSGIDQKSIRYLDFSEDIRITGERPDKKDIIDQYKTDYPQYANIPNNRIIVMRSRPYIEFNPRNSSEPVQLPLDTKTQQTLIKEFVKTIETLKHERAITIPNIVELVRTSQYQSDDDRETPEKARIRAELKTKQTPLMAAILQHFVSRPGTGSGVYPMQILSKATNMSQYGIQTVGSLISDFGEVIAPVAYITGNTTGNAGRMITEVLGATTQKLMQDATIHFNVGATERLYDSFIEYGGKVIGISSKGHADAKAAAVNTNISSLSKAINEIKSNSDALDRLRVLFRKPENKRMFDIVTKIAEDRGRGSKTEKTLRLLQLLDPQYPAKEMFSDLKFLKNLQSKEGRDELERYKQSEQPRRVANQLYSQLSQYIQTRMQASERKLSTSRGRENITNPWDLFLTVANDEIRNTLNSDPLFSEICTWILNHSNTVQIDVYSQNPVSEGRRASANFGQALVVTNIVATWPSTRVDRIELQDVKGESIQFKLLVNGYAKAYPDRAYKPFKSMDFRDQVDPNSDDRTDSTNYTAQDWQNNSNVTGVRSKVSLPGVNDNSNIVSSTQISPVEPRVNATIQKQPVKNVYFTVYPQNIGMQNLAKLREKYGDASVRNDWNTLTFQQFTEKYFPTPEEQRIRNIITLARKQGKAADEGRARKEIESFGLEGNTDEDLAYSISESRSAILRGLLGMRLRESAMSPPSVAYHITRSSNLKSIMQHGLRPSSSYDSEFGANKPRVYLIVNTQDINKKNFEYMIKPGYESDPLVLLKIDAEGLQLEYEPYLGWWSSPSTIPAERVHNAGPVTLNESVLCDLTC